MKDARKKLYENPREQEDLKSIQRKTKKNR